jgi:uncharacterized protein YegP (UPF0339 family)
MSLHTINTYQDKQGQWRWNISVTPGTPGGTPDDVVADSAQGYDSKHEMLTSFFGVYFGTYDDSFLELYQEWNPSDDGQGVPSSVVVNEAPSVEEQAGAETNG